ncbi:VWA domain-containing protein [Myxococcota bacterium]|nr:VWA domain-containing protein [Myxococcota bacterium]
MTDATQMNWLLHDPQWLLLLLALPPVAWLRARRGQPALVIPFANEWTSHDPLPRSRWPVALLFLGLALIIFALARPQKIEDRRLVRQKGYDIVLAIDLSTSMLEEDYERGGRRMNRLSAIKPIVEAFMAQRPSDRIGVVAFGGRAYTLAPLSFDHTWLRRQVGRLRVGLVEDGTAVGDALALSVSRLGQVARVDAGQRQGGFVILLTDGASNSGSIAPLDAARVAAAKGIPVYTIGAGTQGGMGLGMPFRIGRRGSDLDEATLQNIAKQTGGRYFRAADSSTVDAAFTAIDAERKIEFDAKSNVRARELFGWFAWPGVGLCLAAFWLAPIGERRRATPNTPRTARSHA